MSGAINNSIEILLEQNQTELLQTKVSPGFKKLMENEAAKKQMKVAGFVRVILADYFKRNK
jgi:hypothetical protein